MRAILTLLAVAAIVAAALLYFGIITLSGTPGQMVAPTVHADVGRVTLGTEKHEVTTPTINVERPGGNTQAPR